MKLKSLLLTLTIYLVYSSLFSQAGSLDPTFSGDGYVETTVQPYNYYEEVVVQPDGKIVAVGVTSNGSTSTYLIVRYNTNGTLDNSFDTDGIVTSPVVDTCGYQYTSVKLQTDGKIVVGRLHSSGLCGLNRFSVARYNADGTIDNSFDTDGIVVTSFGIAECYIRDVVIQSDGKIIAIGALNNGTENEFALARYNSDGSLDNTFDSDGRVSALFGAGISSFPSSGLIQGDGKIVVGGHRFLSSQPDFGLMRFNTNGSLDTTFSGDGKVTTDFSTSSDELTGLLLQPDGKIVATGYTSVPGNDNLALARYNTNGTLDNTFNSTGLVTTEFGMYDYSYDSELQPDGKIIMCGQSHNGTDFNLILARYNTNGSLDNSFDADGMYSTVFDSASYAGAVTLQPDHKIVVVGSSDNEINSFGLVARFYSGLNVGVINFPISDGSAFVYPNPVSNHATIRYQLIESQNISISMVDMNGGLVKDLLPSHFEVAGLNEHTFVFPENLASGEYFIIISSPEGKISIKIIK